MNKENEFKLKEFLISERDNIDRDIDNSWVEKMTIKVMDRIKGIDINKLSILGGNLLELNLSETGMNYRLFLFHRGDMNELSSLELQEMN